MSSLDQACDAVNLVTAAVSAVRFVEHRVFVEDLIDRCASTHWVDLAEHVVEIAKQQSRCSLGHGFSPNWLVRTSVRSNIRNNGQFRSDLSTYLGRRFSSVCRILRHTYPAP